MRETRTAVYTLGERIRKAREDMGWDQIDLAVHVKKGRSTVANWETNKHKPSALELDKIAEVTGYPVEFFTDTAGVTLYQERRMRRDIPGRRNPLNLVAA